MVRRSLVLAVLIAGMIAFSGGSASAAPGKTVQRLVQSLGCDPLTVGDGLPNSTVLAIVQDRRGFIWLGTSEGLARYDGTAMRVFRPIENDPTSISSGYITALTLDPSGKLWVGTVDNGANLYDPDTDKFTRFARGTAKDSFNGDGVTAIVRDRKDRVWFAANTGGLNRFDPSTGTFVTHATKPLDVVIKSMAVDPTGALWLGTEDDGVILWNPDAPATISRPIAAADRGAASITAILVASSGKVWIGIHGEGVVAFEPKTGKVVEYRRAADDPTTLSDNNVDTLFEDRSKNVWIGTKNGLSRVEPSGRLTRYQHDADDPTSLSFNAVESIFQDAGAVMWIGGYTVGVCKFDELRSKFGYHRLRNNATAMLEDTDGAVWIGTYNNGLHKYERAAQRVTVYHDLGPSRTGGATVKLDDPDSAAWITVVHRDRRGTLWVSIMDYGLVAFDTKTETHRAYVPDPETPNSLPEKTTLDIWEDDQGTLWLATWGGGLARYNPQLDNFTTVTADTSADPTGLTSNHIYRLYPDPTDKKILWIGTGKGGLVRFNTVSGSGTSFRRREGDPESLSHDDVMTIYRDPAGIVWAGTYGGGLNRLDPATGKVERFTTGNSTMAHDTILGILPDADGKLWMSTNGAGIVQLDPKTRKFVAYEASDGVQDNEFSQNAFMRTKAGELFFGGGKGFNAFSPRDIHRDPYVPPVVVTAFKLFNQELTLERPIWTLPPVELAYHDSFEVQFAALAFASSKRNRYAYKLEGFDDEFIESDRPFATYTKLGVGNFTLRVRASNRHGVWTESAIALKLAVAPPWWRTWAAYGVYLFLLAAGVYLLFYTQRQRVRRAEREGRLAVVERDLELTGAVQTGFLPDHNEINYARLQLFGLYRPADACGGDWWWHETLAGGRHVVMVGDVTGHGPGPAMVTAAVATAFRVLIENGLSDMRQCMEMLNREVLRVAKGKYHMTMVALEIDEGTGSWICHNAGAPPMLSLDRSGKHKVYLCAGAPLGTESGFETGLVEGRFERNERMLLYTDGIPEIILANGNVFGVRRFAQLYERTRGQDLKEASSTIVAHADQSLGGTAQADDWTFTMIEWN